MFKKDIDDEKVTSSTGVVIAAKSKKSTKPKWTDWDTENGVMTRYLKTKDGKTLKKAWLAYDNGRSKEPSLKIQQLKPEKLTEDEKNYL
jgi:hypothetical protein